MDTYLITEDHDSELLRNYLKKNKEQNKQNKQTNKQTKNRSKEKKEKDNRNNVTTLTLIPTLISLTWIWHHPLLISSNSFVIHKQTAINLCHKSNNLRKVNRQSYCYARNYILPNSWWLNNCRGTAWLTRISSESEQQISAKALLSHSS